jgi:hypothetical protein
MPRKRLSVAEHARRGTYQPARHGLKLASVGSVEEEDWLRGLSKEARLEGIWLLGSYQFTAADRRAFRNYLRGWAVRQRLRERHMAENRRLESWLWQLSQRLPWRLR